MLSCGDDGDGKSDVETAVDGVGDVDDDGDACEVRI